VEDASGRADVDDALLTRLILNSKKCCGNVVFFIFVIVVVGGQVESSKVSTAGGQNIEDGGRSVAGEVAVASAVELRAG
jgi:hypothetical protein